MRAVAKAKNEPVFKVAPLLLNVLQKLPKNLDSLSLYSIYLLVLLCPLEGQDQLKEDLRESINSFSADQLDILELWSLFKIDQLISGIPFVQDSKFKDKLEQQILVYYQLTETETETETMQLNEMRNQQSLQNQLEAIPQESSNLQIALRKAAVFEALMTAIKRRFPGAELVEESIVKGHSLDIVITDTKKQPPLKLNIELDGKHHQWEFQKAKDSLRDKILAQDGWYICRIPNSDLIGKESAEQTSFLLQCIDSILPEKKSTK
jgi:very-short-patch-repair endonuclease